MSLLHSSTRRPSPLRDVDYDHEINLIDHTRSQSASPSASPGALSTTSSRRHSDAPLRKRESLRKELTRRKFNAYQDRRLDGFEEQAEPSGEESTEDRGRPRVSSDPGKGKLQKERQTAIDILYENQRGWCLCGIPLFSSRALGNLDPSPWTNEAQKTSATDTTNAQVPDPTWQWASKEWTVNHQEEVDDEGWEYSFAFSKKFSWHGLTWWNSFVRRRAWVRRRVKKESGYHVQEGHMLNADYFTIHPAQNRSRSRTSTANESAKNRYSIIALARREMEGAILVEDICDIGSLMKVLRICRIDREKMEAVENFIRNGGDDLYYLRERMHDIMHMFIFQASRRLLLSHLLGIFNEATDEQKKNTHSEKEPNSTERRRLENLEAALKHADEEVKRLEFWSDIKDMAEKGETKGAVDGSQGWDKSWTGLDSSAPKDVISDRELPGTDDCEKGEGNGTAILGATEDKGKGKEKE